jgi:formate hydrogenlyase transcriptional activator
MKETTELRRAELMKEDLLGFEVIISELLARFLNAPDARIDAEIEDAIRRIAESLDLDQGLLVQWGDDSALPLPTHSWTVPWGLRPPVAPGSDVVPWVHHQSVLGKIVMFSRVEDLPPEAEKDKQFFRASGRKALISLPVRIDGRVIGALIFASLHAETDWSDEVVRRLGIIADVFANLLDRQNGKQELEARLRFEALLADLSSHFVNIAPDQVDEEIEDALKQVLEFFQVDRCGLLGISTDRTQVHVTHAAYAEGIARVSGDIDLAALYPWSYELLVNQGKHVSVPKTAEPPPGAEIDRQSWAAMGIQSSLTVPLFIGGKVCSLFALNAVQRPRSWPETYVSRLRLLGEIFVNALERRRGERALRESEERLSLAAGSAGVVLWDLETDSGRIWVSEEAMQLFSWPQDSEMTLESFLNVVHPEDRERLRRTVDEIMKSGKDSIVEYRIVRSDGIVRWMHSRGRPYPSTTEEPARLTGVTVDITDRRKAEKALTENRERYRAMVEAYDGYIYICTRDYRIEFMSESLINRTGRDATGESCYKVLHERDSVCPWCVNERVFQGETVRWEVQSPKDNRWYYVVNTPIRHPDGTFSKQSIIMDITDRKQSEQEIRSAYEEIKNLKDRLEVENVRLREEINRAPQFDDIIGQSDAMKYVFFRIQQVAPTNSTVLITGETGTGKGLVARALHSASKRRDRQMVMVNCAALPAGLIESELFGKEKGAFTGAHTSQMGRFELADKGTIFLDEIGDLPLELQAKLLRVIENGEFERLGSSRTVKVDVRIIASTNRDLEKETREGRFREDLFYRLNVFPLTMPPLRQRKDDIPLLVLHFVKKHGRKMGKDITEIPRKVMKALEEFPWPGNVRELENIIERAVISAEGHVLELAECVSAAFLPLTQNTPGGLSGVEREHILKILKQTLWRIEGHNGAAQMLGLKPSTLRSRMKKLGIRKTESR